PEDVFVLAARRGVEPGHRPHGWGWSCSFEDCCAIRHTRRLRESVSRPGFEPGPEPSEGPMRSATPSGHDNDREELTPVKKFWRLPALPGAHSCMLPIPRWVAMVSEGSRTL